MQQCIVWNRPSQKTRDVYKICVIPESINASNIKRTHYKFCKKHTEEYYLLIKFCRDCYYIEINLARPKTKYESFWDSIPFFKLPKFFYLLQKKKLSSKATAIIEEKHRDYMNQ